MSRDFRHKEPAKKRGGMTPKTYTLGKTYKITTEKMHEGKWQAERHDDMIVRIIEEWYNRSSSKGRTIGTANRQLYDRRAAEYMQLRERLKGLEPLKDYAEINNIHYKMNAIKSDFENLPNVYSENNTTNPNFRNNF